MSNAAFYIQPIKSDGTLAAPAAVRGTFTLASSTTYYIPLKTETANLASAHLQWDAAMVLTSVTVEDSNMDEDQVTWYSGTAADWIDEDPSTAFVGVVGSGVSATNGVVAATGGAAGGCMFHLPDSGAARTRLKVVVGATGGVIKAAGHLKKV